MKIVSLKEIGLPIYIGLETSNEDVVYSYFRAAFAERGYALKVKRSGYTEIDAVMRSGKNGTHGKGSCDAYIFTGSTFHSFRALLELESTGKLDVGVKQVTDYAKSFTVKTLPEELKNAVEQIVSRDILLIVFDGQKLWAAKYSFDDKKLEVIIDKVDVAKDRIGVTQKLFANFPDLQVKPRAVDEKKLVDQVADLIRGHEKFQKNKALVMTILASIFGATQEDSYEKACAQLKSSQEFYESHIYETFNSLKSELGDNCDSLLRTLYRLTAPFLYELSQDKGMDLYGFIYEELATKDTKKEQGEYYTPRHTIRPILSSVARQYLKWDKSELGKKIVLDPFCGSGGFLYEYIHLQKANHGLTRLELDRIAKQSLFGIDKSEPLAAYLNLYLIGDGSANLRKVATTINWREEIVCDIQNSANGKASKAVRITSPKALSAKLRSRSADLDFLIKLYSPLKLMAEDKYKDLAKLAEEGDPSPIDSLILSKSSGNLTASDFGNVDLLLTNVPYGKAANPLEQFAEQGETPYGRSLEANALRECIDFLRPAKMENGKVKELGGVAIAIIPDSILENPSNKPIRDYLIARCEVLSIIGLPPFTFSPYAMEKTYAIVFRKLSPQQFDIDRDLSLDKVFFYYSLSDGKANSVNRFSTSHITRSETKIIGGAKRKVAEFAHNDFLPCFDSYFDDKHVYLSKLERAWDSTTWNLNKEWDQLRITEEWTGTGWNIEPGSKWGFYPLVREQREYREEVHSRSLKNKLEAALPIADLFTAGETIFDFSQQITQLDELALSTKDRELLDSLSEAEILFDEVRKEYSLVLYRTRMVSDVVLNPDDHRYLGQSRPDKIATEILSDLQALPVVNESTVIEYFRSKFVADQTYRFTLSEKFDVLQGTQFSKFDAYSSPGVIPVYTAATSGPAYFCAANIAGKVSVRGPVLIWSRKGAKAGTIQMFGSGDSAGECYISDVSGAIKPKNATKIDLTFMRYFVAGQVKAQIQAQDNNAQLNKSKLESLKIVRPENHEAIGQFLRSKGL